MIIVFLLSLAPFSADRVEIIKDDGESIVHLVGNVVIEDEKTRITCAEAHYHEMKNYVILTDNIRIVDDQGEISADIATYDFESKQGFLKGNVRLMRKNEIFTSDSLLYDGAGKDVRMFSNVMIEATDSTLRAFGTSAQYDLDAEIGWLTENPSLEIIRKERSPMLIDAQRFRLDNKKNVLYGYDSVVARIDSVIVTCDTFVYDVKTTHGTMTKPTITEIDNRLIGETGSFVMKDNDIETLSVHNGWSQYYTKNGTKNTIEGETITIVFEEGQANRIIVIGEPRGVVHMGKGNNDVSD